MPYKGTQHMKKQRTLIFLLIVFILVISGCLQQQAGETSSAGIGETSELITDNPTKPPSPQVLSFEAVEDASVDAADMEDPHSDLNKYIADEYKPDIELYNFLYRKVDAMSKEADLSGFDLTFEEKYATAGCLFAETNFRFFYFKNFKLRNDGGIIKFLYYDIMPDDMALNKETLCARLSHLFNNVAPERYSQLQKFMALYQHICDISDYTHDISDITTHSPYSILTGGRGICAGYAQLMEYALGKLGIECEYVTTDAHAWNIVKLGGKWYHTDVTWGVGTSADPRSNLCHILMDDETRLTSLGFEGLPLEKIIVGYAGGDEEAPPACTDTSYKAYYITGFCQALDIENGKVYFSDIDSIDRMNLDCTGRETLVHGDSCRHMYWFDGALYYNSANDGHIYRIAEGKEPELLDGSDMFFNMALCGTRIIYGRDESGDDSLTINLMNLPDETRGALMLSEASTKRSRSFCVRIRFSEPMDEAQNWSEHVYLADDKGSAIPLHFVFDSKTNTLTVRPKIFVADFPYVNVYVTSGAEGLSGGKTDKCWGMKVNIVSEANAVSPEAR